MRPSVVPDTQWSQLSGFIAGAMGLHFPRERWPDLQRGLAGAAAEFGFDDVAECADWLLSAPLGKAQQQVLASHLTVGETYFLREKKSFEVLAARVLPELIRSRRGREQRLRLWSAGCCTGEEPYSLAILLQQLLPDLADWHVTILATDINARFLRKAVAGSYGEWSFRDAPEGLRERYFNRSPEGRYLVAPETRRMVTFEHLNLVEDAYPSLTTDTNAMDVILCRNVLMYFSPEQIRRVIGKFRHALLDGGWLLVSPSEASQELFSRFATRNFPGVILYQKSDAYVGGAGFQSAGSPISNRPDADPGWNPELGELSAGWKPAPPQTASLRSENPPPEKPAPLVPTNPPVPEQTRPTPYAVAGALYKQGRYEEAADTLLASLAGHTPESPGFSLLARALANQGRLAEALTWCDRGIAADKLDSAAHYLRAVVLLEQGAPEEARRSLQRAVYLHHDFVLAHFALGNLARSGAKTVEAGRHFGNARQLLARLRPDDPLPESDGLTAGRLLETITALENTQ